MKIFSKKYDYISILTGGKCGFNCSFCIGNKLNKDKEPHFSNQYTNFVENYANRTNIISISGSSSDPYFISIQKHIDIINKCKDVNPKIVTNIHTRYIKDAIKLNQLMGLYDGIVFSVDEDFLNRSDILDFKKYSHKKMRFSIVLTNKNRHIFTRDWLDEVYNTTGISSFTFRPDVFENDFDIEDFKINMELFEVVDKKYGVWFPYKSGYVTYWDNKKINQNVLYLWSTNEVTDDCEWKKSYLNSFGRIRLFLEQKIKNIRRLYK